MIANSEVFISRIIQRTMKRPSCEIWECSHCHKKFLSRNNLFRCGCGLLISGSKAEADKFRKRGKCNFCSREEDFLLSLSGDANHTVVSRKFYLNGGRK